MPHYHHTAQVRVWMTGLGVPHAQAERAAQKIAARLDTGDRLEEEELQLIVAYLSRPGANRAADGDLSAVVERQKMYPTPPPPPPPPPPPIPYPIITARPGPAQQGVRTPVSSANAWTDHNTRDPGTHRQGSHPPSLPPPVPGVPLPGVGPIIGSSGAGAQAGPRQGTTDLAFIKTLAAKVGGYG